MAVPRPKNGIINTTAGFIMLPESSDNGVSEETIETVPKKQRRMAERRKAPIVAKHETRNRKINLTSFKQKYLTLKRKVSALHLEVGASEDFLLIVRNNLQEPSASQQCITAGKYMVFGVGPIAEQFYSSGINFETTTMVKMANNYDYELDHSSNHGVNVEADQRKVLKKQAKVNKGENVNRIGSKTKPRKEVDQRKRERSPPQVGNFRPKKVLTPGSNFMEWSESSEDEAEIEKVIGQTTEEAPIDENAQERDANIGFIADSSIELDVIDSTAELGDLL